MFRKFDIKEDVATNTKVKSSVQRGIRTKLLEQMPFLSSPAGEAPAEGEAPTLLEVIWPKKEDIGLVKWSAARLLRISQGRLNAKQPGTHLHFGAQGRSTIFPAF